MKEFFRRLFKKRYNEVSKFKEEIDIGPVLKNKSGMFLIDTNIVLETDSGHTDRNFTTLIREEDFFNRDILIIILSFIKSNIYVRSGQRLMFTEDLTVLLDESDLIAAESNFNLNSIAGIFFHLFLGKGVIGDYISIKQLVYSSSCVDFEVKYLEIMYIDFLGMIHTVNIPTINYLLKTDNPQKISYAIQKEIELFEKIQSSKS